MKAVYNDNGTRVPGMFEKGTSAPEGYHFMPDGRLMKDSDHKMQKGGHWSPKAKANRRAKRAKKRAKRSCAKPGCQTPIMKGGKNRRR